MTSPKSAPTPETTPVDPVKPVANAADAVVDAANPPAADDSNSQPKPALESSGFSLKASGFSLALTILAILPVAIGIGTVRVKAAARANQIELLARQQQLLLEAEPPPPPRPVDLQDGDDLFFERRFQLAIDAYHTFICENPERKTDEFDYRLGLCHEGLGHWDEARRIYEQILATTPNHLLRTSLRFGQARIELQTNNVAQALKILAALELEQGAAGAIPYNLAHEIDFLFPIALAYDAVSREQQAAGQEPDPVADLFVWSLEAALKWCAQSSLEQGVDAASPANVYSFTKSAMAPDSVNPQAALIQVRCPGLPLAEVVDRVAGEFGWTVDWSDLKEDSALQELIGESADNRPVSLLLTAIGHRLNAMWSLNQQKLTFTRMSGDQHLPLPLIAQNLDALTNWIPNHRHVNQCRFALAQFARVGGDLPQAAKLYSSLAGKDTSGLAVRAAYNAGNVYFQLNDLARAATQLDYVASGAPDFPQHTVALNLLGRVLLDLGETQDAVFQFRRAIEAANRREEQARAATFLGMALLVQEKYVAAAEAILSCRAQIQETPFQNGAALVTALVRWKALGDQQKELESPFLYRALISVNTDPEAFGKMFGQTGELLIGRAYAELGFEDEMAELYLKMRSQGVTASIDTELNLSLGNYDYSHGRFDSAKATWLKAAEGPDELWANRGRKRLAEIALNEAKPDECLKLCEAIEPGQGVSRVEKQKLMGQAYEQLGDAVSAARCYAGKAPLPQQ